MEYFSTPFLLAVLQIIWIDLLLSGDNAVVIALACRSLPPHQRRLGILLGAGTAVGLRIIFAFLITQLLAVSFLKLIGGVLLLWIAGKLVKGEEEEGHEVAESETLWKAVRTIAIADAVMSLDNVVAIAAAAKGHAELFIFGLLLSIPLIIFGSTLIMAIIARYPIFIWAGAALLGWIAGEMVVTDPAVLRWLAGNATSLITIDPADPIGFKPGNLLHYGAAAIGALMVLIYGLMVRRQRRREDARAV